MVVQAGADVLSDPNTVGSPTSPGAAQLNLRALTELQVKMAQIIISAFAAAGFGKLQQVAALAAAQAESDLDPKSRNLDPPREDSVGLFQCNRIGGEGSGFS